VLICEKMNGIWEGQGVYIDRREWSDPWMSLTKSLAGALRHRSCDAGPVCQTPAAFRCHVQDRFCPAITKLSIREPRRMPLVVVDAASHVAVVGWSIESLHNHDTVQARKV
jgi:hypothetical protein